MPMQELTTPTRCRYFVTFYRTLLLIFHYSVYVSSSRRLYTECANEKQPLEELLCFSNDGTDLCKKLSDFKYKYLHDISENLILIADMVKQIQPFKL